MKSKNVIFNEFNLIDKCLVCNKKIGSAYKREDGHLSRVEKSCYKCSTIIWYTFEFDTLMEITLIAGECKLEINNKEGKTYYFRRKIEYLNWGKDYVEIKWVEMCKINEVIDFNINDVKKIKEQMEGMSVFS